MYRHVIAPEGYKLWNERSERRGNLSGYEI